MYKEGKWRFVVITDAANDVFPTIGDWPGNEIQVDTWPPNAGTYDGATAKIFKNGVEEESYSGEDIGGAILWEDIATDFYIGKYLDANNAFKGSIDEVRLWEMANMENEIHASMNDVLDGDEGGLIGYWNFNDNQSSTVAAHADGVVPGTLTNNGCGDWDTDVFAPTGPCYDLELTEENFPYNHLADLGLSTDDYDMKLLNDSGGSVNNANGNDYTYKLPLNADTTIYITTCDVETNHDVQIAIYNEVCDEASWILFQDDSNLDILRDIIEINPQLELNKLATLSFNLDIIPED